MTTAEVSIAAVIGPSHHFAGAASGNMASVRNKGRSSNPRAAALQSLGKCRLLHKLGIPQLLVPPHPTPNQLAARMMGIDLFDDALALHPARLACWSSSSMWTANWATVRPSVDGADARVHVTPANLVSNLHRALEVGPTSRRLSELLPGIYFCHHDALPSATMFADEGAANHMRLWTLYTECGLHVFVFGNNGVDWTASRFSARQHIEASVAVARLHQLAPGQSFFLQQSTEAIDAGVFHNDVICTSYRDFVLCHERAFEDQEEKLEGLKEAFRKHCGGELRIRIVSERELPLTEAVRCYLFNAEIVADTSGTVWMLAPAECRQSEAAQATVGALVEDAESPIDRVKYVQLDESMRNGGGPACLRLRLPLSEAELATTKKSAMFTPSLCEELEGIIESTYPDTLNPASDLTSAFASHCHTVVRKMSRLLGYDVWES